MVCSAGFESRSKLTLTLRTTGLTAAVTAFSNASPFTSEGLRPDKISGQNRRAELSIAACAAAAPWAKAIVFSVTANIASAPFGALLLASKAMMGRRMPTTGGANSKSP